MLIDRFCSLWTKAVYLFPDVMLSNHFLYPASYWTDAEESGINHHHTDDAPTFNHQSPVEKVNILKGWTIPLMFVLIIWFAFEFRWGLAVLQYYLYKTVNYSLGCVLRSDGEHQSSHVSSGGSWVFSFCSLLAKKKKRNKMLLTASHSQSHFSSQNNVESFLWLFF